jgi:hypothetical protein
MSGGPDLAAGWQTSSLSAGGECVAVLFADGQVHVRHSRQPTSRSITFSEAEWTAFVGGVRRGEFEVPRETGEPGSYAE